MNKIVHTPDGVRDWLPEECEVKNGIVDKVENTFLHYGYKKLESPIFEFAEIFDVTLTNKSQNQLYRFSDEKGNMLALRADMTPPIVRIACTAYKNETNILRFFYSGNIFINNKNLQGKLRESSQAGIELMGVNSVEADAEAVEITIKGLEAAGVKDFIINIGHADFVKGVLADCRFDSQTNKQILELLGNMDYAGIAAVVKQEEHTIDSGLKYILENIPLLVGDKQMILDYQGKVENELSIAALRRLLEIYEILEDAGLGKYISFDLGIVNHLNYYTGLMFRAYALGTGFPVASGGRYDMLAESFGVKMPAVGVAIKVNNIMEVFFNRKIEPDTRKEKFVISYDKHCENGSRGAAYKTALLLRQKGFIVENGFGGGNVRKHDADKLLHFTSGGSAIMTDTKTNSEIVTTIEDLHRKFSLGEGN